MKNLAWWVLVCCALGCGKTTYNADASNNRHESTGGSGGEGNGGSGQNGSNGSSTGGNGSGGFAGGFVDETPGVDILRQGGSDKLDLLFVIDNSPSMADKQALLAQAVPGLLNRLINPACVADDGSGLQSPDANGDCANGFTKEFDPLDDIHIGVITSSLGGRGGDLCSPDTPTGGYDPAMNDRGLLLPSVRPDLPSYAGQGFLAWDPLNRYPGAETDSLALMTQFTNQAVSAGENGCGFSMPLEAWYRFLIDPAPAAEIVVEGGVATPRRNSDGSVVVDEDVLAQRANFLRPDSMVAIVMLSDANDCSIVDNGIGYLTAKAELDGRSFNLPQSTSACDSDPNSPCCRSCGLNEPQPPSGCASLGSDEKCQEGRREGTDALALRCHDQKRRFGFDLLHPIQRYVDGLTQLQVYDTNECVDGNCPLVENPLFVGSPARDPSLVFLVGIVGVPWQDIATQDSLSGVGLRYKTFDEMLSDGTFDLILGEPAANIPPADPLMIESPLPREGANPVTGEPLAPAESIDPQANSINGHEYDNPTLDDLQYACIFPLAMPRNCLVGGDRCDCTEADLPKNRPLCNPPGGGAADTTQFHGKAYPGLRQLNVLRDFGRNSAIGSLCPKNPTGDVRDPFFGFNPAMQPLIEAIKRADRGRCLPRALPIDDEGFAACAVVEVTRDDANVPSCNQRVGRRPVAPDSELASDTLTELEGAFLCGRGTTVDCASFELCEIEPLQGNARERCLNEVEASDDGFCYIDADAGIGNPALVDHCPPEQMRRLRFVSADGETPVSGAVTVLVCQ